MQPEPDLTNLEAAVAAAREAGVNVVIGFGGGSLMDLAKLVAVLVGTDQGLRDISGPNRAPARRVGLVQIPTTAGTGSEVGTRALITDPDTMNKIATESREMLADIAIIDPELTVSVPPMVTAATGVDAMAHCVEAFTSRRSHPIIDAYALQGIELVGRYLRRAVEDGADLEARAGLALAAFYGGVCLGPVNTTAGHALAYPLGTRHKLAHGIANALIFPHVLAVNAPAAPEKTALVGQALGFGAEDASRCSAAPRTSASVSASTWPCARMACRATTCRLRPARRMASAACSTSTRSISPRPTSWKSMRRPTDMTRQAFVALVTCFNDDETINFAATRAQVRRQVEAGNNIMCAGTNGDFTALTFDGKSGSAPKWSRRWRGAPASSSTPACPRPSRPSCWRANSSGSASTASPSSRPSSSPAPGRPDPPLLLGGRCGLDARLPLRHPRPHPEPHRAMTAKALAARQHQGHQGFRRRGDAWGLPRRRP